MKPAQFQLYYSLYTDKPELFAEGSYSELLNKVPRLVKQLRFSMAAHVWVEKNGVRVHNCSIDYFGVHYSKYTA